MGGHEFGVRALLLAGHRTSGGFTMKVSPFWLFVSCSCLVSLQCLAEPSQKSFLERRRERRYKEGTMKPKERQAYEFEKQLAEKMEKLRARAAKVGLEIVPTGNKRSAKARMRIAKYRRGELSRTDMKSVELELGQEYKRLEPEVRKAELAAYRKWADENPEEDAKRWERARREEQRSAEPQEQRGETYVRSKRAQRLHAESAAIQNRALARQIANERGISEMQARQTREFQEQEVNEYIPVKK